MTPGDLGRAAGFYAIALGLAVVVALLAPLLGGASLLLTMFTPAIAVAVMLGLVAPEGPVRAALAGLGLTQAGLKGWPLAIAGPVLIHAIGIAVLVLAGLAAFATGLVAATVFALAEEVGWRGCMLPRMTGHGVVATMLATGSLHGGWHLPLMLLTDLYHAGVGVFFGFLRIWTGNVWPVAIAHAAANTAWEASGDLTLPRSPLASEYVGGESGLVVIAALLILSVPILRFMRRRGMA